MEEFLIEYANAFYESLEKIKETIRIIIPLVLTVTWLVIVLIFAIGLIAYIYDEIKRRTK